MALVITPPSRYSQRMKTMQSRLKQLVILAAVGLAIGLGAGYLFSDKNTHAILESSETGRQGGDFVVQSHAGDIRLSDYTGKVVLLYFGYTYCPDICPTSLTLMSNAFKALSAKELKQVQGIFISVDPDRDKTDKLQKYTQYFHPQIIGATSNKANIDDIVKCYGAFYRKVDTGSAAGYSVDHSSSTVLINKEGKIMTVIPHGTSGEDVAKYIREAL